MHFLVEVWIPAFAIILNTKRLNLALIQDPINTGFRDGCKPFKTRFNSIFIDMLCKSLGSSGLGSVTIVFRLCAGYADQPGFRFTGDFFFTAAAFVYIKKIVDGIFC